MGCDIHLIIQYKKHDSWRIFGGEFRLPRHYTLFGHLANGVRSDFEGPQIKGLPKDFPLYNEGFNVFFLYIDAPEEGRSITKEDALSRNEMIYNPDGIEYISDSDLHSHSWLTLGEYISALSKYSPNGELIPVEYLAIRAAMTALAVDYPEVRIVFAFDN